MTLPNAILWIDHSQARVILFDEETARTQVIRPAGGPPHLHHKANSAADGHAPEDQDFLHEVGQSLSAVRSVLIAGPANAKLELMKHLAQHDPQLLDRVSGVETTDHPSDGQLLDRARRHFAVEARRLRESA